MAEPVFPWYPPIKSRISLKIWKILEFLAIFHVCLLRLFLLFLQNFGFSVYVFFINDGWFCCWFCREVIKKKYHNCILWRFYFVKKMWLIPVLYFYARGEKIMIPAIFNSLIEGIFITKWLSKFHKEVFCFTELSLFADVTDGSCCRLIPNNYYYSLMYGTWNWLCTWDEEE